MSDNVTEALKSFFSRPGRQVAFIGAGVSARAGLPAWGGLINNVADSIRGLNALVAQVMLEELRKKNYTLAMDYFEICDIVAGEKQRILRGNFSGYNADLIVPIAKLPVETFLTTNFDRSLHDAIAQARQRSAGDYRYGDSSFRQVIWDASLLVARIHGAIENPDSVVLSRIKFNALMKDENYRELLTNCFSQRNVIFVGFSFYDPAIRHILEEIDRIHGPSTPGRHMALLPSDASSEFLQKAARLNIEVVSYDGSNSHEALWEGIGKFNQGASAQRVKKSSSYPAIKRYLAVCYARAKASSYSRPLRESVMEAIVAGILQDISPNAATRAEILENVRKATGLKKNDTESLVDRALSSVRESGLVRRMKSDSVTKYAWHDQSSVDATIRSDINYLCECLEARAKVQEGWAIGSTVRSALPNLFSLLVRDRGWDLGAAFAAGRPPEPVELASLLATPSLQLPAYDQERLSRVLLAMLQEPTEREDHLLSAMGRAAFAIELAFNTPRTALLHSAVLPQSIYLDASVLLPAIVSGHPFSTTYTASIKRLREAASSAGVDLRMKVSTVYLNEVISHKRKALAFIAASGEDARSLALRDARLGGAENTNVYIGAYATYAAGNSSLTFSDFLEKNAPYADERELKRFLEQRGYTVVSPRRTSKFSEIYSQLERDYANALVRGKTSTLIEHDALQLASVYEDLKQGQQVFLVSADRQLREFVGAGLDQAVADAMISHVGLVQLIELMLGGVPETPGFTQLLWGARHADDKSSIRAYLVAQALRAYDAALLMTMPVLIESLADEFEDTLGRQGISLDSERPETKTKALRALGLFEADFFQKMDAEMAKIKRHLGP